MVRKCRPLALCQMSLQNGVCCFVLTRALDFWFEKVDPVADVLDSTRFSCNPIFPLKDLEFAGLFWYATPEKAVLVRLE